MNGPQWRVASGKFALSLPVHRWCLVVVVIGFCRRCLRVVSRAVAELRGKIHFVPLFTWRSSAPLGGWV